MKVGDKLHIVGYQAYGSHPVVCRIATVERITPSGQVVDSNGGRWKPSRSGQSYRAIGDSGDIIVDVDTYEKALAEIRTRQLRSTVRDTLDKRIMKLTPDQMARILEILQEGATQ